MLAERAAMSEEGREEARLCAEAEAEAAQERIDALSSELVVAKRQAKQAQQEAASAVAEALAAGARQRAAAHRRASGAGEATEASGPTSPDPPGGGPLGSPSGSNRPVAGNAEELVEAQARASAMEQELKATKVRQ